VTAIPSIHRLSFDGVSGTSGLGSIGGENGISHGPQVGLADGFKKALDDARALDKNATEQAEKFANNDPSIGIHEVMIASEKANIALRYATTLKNKALEAYHELMATQV
jgi:flagellar hook-basal body complex protein FliE